MLAGDWMSLRKMFLFMLALLALTPLVFPGQGIEPPIETPPATSEIEIPEEEPTYTEALFEEQTESSSLELVYNWQLLAVAALIISSVIVAISYAVSIGMEMPQLKAWAGTELRQIIANAVLIVIIFVVIEFLDVMVIMMVNTSAPGGLHCDIGESCLQKVSLAYINDYVDSAETGIKDVVKNNMKASAWVGRGIGIYGTSIKVGQIGISTPLAAYYMLDVDRYHIVFEYYMGILSSLYSQKFFLSQFCFKIGPIVLAIGIVARSFFFTRKTGGLLIAVAVGVMFVFPLMYLFDWMTLDMVVQGDNAILDDPSLCPDECLISAPIAYVNDEPLYKTDDVYATFGYAEDASEEVREEEREKARQIITGELSSSTNLTGSTIFSCYYGGESGGCPRGCRELPYPNSAPACAAPENQSLCAELDEICKVVRYIPGGTTEPEFEECPNECKIVPPLKSDCDVDRCLESRLDCRVAKRTDLDWRPTVDERVEGSERCNEYAADCPASLTAEDTCVWVIPETGPCDDLCAGCPAHCRISGGNVDNLASDCFDGDTDEYLEACTLCTDLCKVSAVEIAALNPVAPNCTGCPIEKRVLGSSLPEELITGDCSIGSCPRDYRLYPPTSACSECLFTPETYTYNPPINMECGELCKPPNNAPMKDPGDYSKVDEDGLVGKSEIKTVSKLMIPGYLLPLFNIVATLVFIRSFSGMIGGDIDIPGISKLF